MSPSVFLPRSAETLAVRTELRAGSGPQHRHALKALAALSEPDETDPVPTAVDVPPLPEDLRSRWREAYGDERAPAPQPVRRAARSGGFAEWLASLLQPRQLAWGGTCAVALWLGTLAVFHDWGSNGTGATGVVTRGASHVPASTAQSRHVLVITAREGSEALMAKLTAAYPSRHLERFASAEEAAASVNAAPGECLVVDVAARTLSVRSGGRTLKEFPLDADSLAVPDTVVLRIEDADELLNQPAAPGR